MEHKPNVPGTHVLANEHGQDVRGPESAQYEHRASAYSTSVTGAFLPSESPDCGDPGERRRRLRWAGLRPLRRRFARAEQAREDQRGGRETAAPIAMLKPRLLNATSSRGGCPP